MSPQLVFGSRCPKRCEGYGTHAFISTAGAHHAFCAVISRIGLQLRTGLRAASLVSVVASVALELGEEAVEDCRRRRVLLRKVLSVVHY